MASEAGRSRVWPSLSRTQCRVRRSASRRRGAVADDARTREVGPCHSGCEAGEQSEEIHCGSVCREGRSRAGRAKGGDQGKCGPAKHVPGAEPDERVTGAGTHTAICRHTPEVGAVCGKAARTVLCGGRAMKRTFLSLSARHTGVVIEWVSDGCTSGLASCLVASVAWPLATVVAKRTQ